MVSSDWIRVLLFAGSRLKRFPPKKCLSQIPVETEAEEDNIRKYTWQHFRSREHPEESITSLSFL